LNISSAIFSSGGDKLIAPVRAGRLGRALETTVRGE
jgi:hypothetical protein